MLKRIFTKTREFFPFFRSLETRIGKGKVVVIYYKKNCPACKVYRELLPDISGRLLKHHIEVITVDRRKNPKLYSEASKNIIPLTAIYLDGELLDSESGSMSYKIAVPWILKTYGIDSS